jgi:PPOX class probable F420-dependent enzyme
MQTTKRGLAFDPEKERYVSLASFRSSGKEVRTPVWIGADETGVYIYTNIQSGKVKRIRKNARVRLAPCTVRGEITGDWVDARAVLVEDETDRERGLRTLVKKYGWQMKAALLLSRLSGRYAQRAVLRIEPRAAI